MNKNKINPNLFKSMAPPIEEMLRLYEKNKKALNLPLLDLSQAAPSSGPPKALQSAIVKACKKPVNHIYGSILGKIELREIIAEKWSDLYDANIVVSEVGVTSGCNQAFCAAISSVAASGDSVILPFPCYFNHKMWLEMQGIKVIELPCTSDLLPDFNAAKRLYSKSVKAIVLVTPNNPTGREYPDNLIQKFADLVKEKNSVLIIDETYRDFISDSDLLHKLFQRPDWKEWLIHIYSFSKAYRITGHRIGAFITSSYRTKQIEKFLDAVTICPNQLGQEAAIFGLKHMASFLERERISVLNRKKTLLRAMKKLPKWKILSIGAFFAFIEYPMALTSSNFSEILLKEVAILVVPGSIFESKSSTIGSGNRTFRLAFANIKKESLLAMVNRLKSFETIFHEKYCVQQESSLEDLKRY